MELLQNVVLGALIGGTPGFVWATALLVRDRLRGV